MRWAATGKSASSDAGIRQVTAGRGVPPAPGGREVSVSGRRMLLVYEYRPYLPSCHRSAGLRDQRVHQRRRGGLPWSAALGMNVEESAPYRSQLFGLPEGTAQLAALTERSGYGRSDCADDSRPAISNPSSWSSRICTGPTGFRGPADLPRRGRTARRSVPVHVPPRIPTALDRGVLRRGSLSASFVRRQRAIVRALLLRGASPWWA